MASDTQHRLHRTIRFPYSLRRIERHDQTDDTAAFAFRMIRVQFSACRSAFKIDKFSTTPRPSSQTSAL
jgi:hypothetical protein